MTISVCVASLGDQPTLERFFDSFATVRKPVPCELLLVINRRQPPDPALASRRVDGYRLTVLHEPVPGKGRALNRALAAAQHDLLVFTDDDVTFEPDWLEELWAGAQRHPGVPIFGGRIQPLGDVPAWILRSVNLQGILLSQHHMIHGEVPYLYAHYPFGPNMAVRRAAVLKANARWREDVGPGTAVPVGDEGEFLAQISVPGTPDRMFLPRAVVHHEVDAGYFALRPALRRTFWCGFAAGQLGAGYGEVDGPQGLAERTIERLQRIASWREFACNVSRTLGYLSGRYLWPRPRPGHAAR